MHVPLASVHKPVFFDVQDDPAVGSCMYHRELSATGSRDLAVGSSPGVLQSATFHHSLVECSASVHCWYASSLDPGRRPSLQTLGGQCSAKTQIPGLFPSTQILQAMV